MLNESDTCGCSISRRALLAGAGASLAAATFAACGEQDPMASTTTMSATTVRPHSHQPGIATPPQRHLQLAAFDLQRDDLDALHDLLSGLSMSARELETQARAARLSLTLGLGPTLFESDGRDRLGLASRRPPRLAPLPGFPGDALEPRHSGGDLCIQACAEEQQVVFDAIRVITHEAAGIATPRWTLHGFLPGTPGTPRNLMGFKDGTNNIAPDDTPALNRHVWVGADDQQSWLHGGTYMIVRRIRTLLDVWDTTSIEEQEATIGRSKDTGAPLGGHREHDRPDLDATHDGAPVIASDAHIRLAAPATNNGVRILRRSYNYTADVDPATRQPDAGLIFISFQRDPAQFTRIQQRLARHDALRKHLLHTGSAIFACPPGGDAKHPVTGGLLFDAS
jgi:deferrochelatase/peroxidase EfeB